MKYSYEVKQATLARVMAGEPAVDVARDFGITRETVGKWARAAGYHRGKGQWMRPAPAGGLNGAERAELARLRQEVAELRAFAAQTARQRLEVLLVEALDMQVDHDAEREMLDRLVDALARPDVVHDLQLVAGA